MSLKWRQSFAQYNLTGLVFQGLGMFPVRSAWGRGGRSVPPPSRPECSPVRPAWGRGGRSVPPSGQPEAGAARVFPSPASLSIPLPSGPEARTLHLASVVTILRSSITQSRITFLTLLLNEKHPRISVKTKKSRKIQLNLFYFHFHIIIRKSRLPEWYCFHLRVCLWQSIGNFDQYNFFFIS